MALSLRLNQNGTYFLTGTQNGQCQLKSDSFNILVLPSSKVNILKTEDTLMSDKNTENEWFLGGLSLGKTQRIIAKQKGWYFLENSIGGRCKSRDSILIENSGIQTIAQSGLKLYPNPSQNNFIVESAETAYLKIYDSSGRLLLEQSIESGLNEIKMDESGVYLIKIENSKGFFKFQILLL